MDFISTWNKLPSYCVFKTTVGKLEMSPVLKSNGKKINFGFEHGKYFVLLHERIESDEELKTIIEDYAIALRQEGSILSITIHKVFDLSSGVLV